MFFNNSFDVAKQIRNLKLAIELQEESIKILKENKAKHSDLNAWLFNSKIEALEYAKNLLLSALKGYEEIYNVKPSVNALYSNSKI